MLKRLGLPNNSVGSISEMLTEAGRKVSNQLNIECSDVFTFSVCSDEVFSKQQPILITVDPVSLLILNIELSDNRNATSWSSHLQCIMAQGIDIIQQTNDEGKGMSSAMAEILDHVDRQSDTFHAVAHRLGKYVDRYFKKACSYIGKSYDAEKAFYKAKSEKAIIKHFNNYLNLSELSKNHVQAYDLFKFLYHCLIESFQIFDNNGVLKNLEQIKMDFNVALELMEEMDLSGLEGEIKSIRKCMPDLFTFYKTAHQVVNTLSQQMNGDVLKVFCLAWQSHKNMIKAKNVERKNKMKNREEYLLIQVRELIGEEFDQLKTTVYESLNNIIQSSAAVECINSILRYYLNSSNNKVNQNFLNLFMFYHNNRKFKSGERKGRSPMEIATGIDQQKDWMELLLNKIA